MGDKSKIEESDESHLRWKDGPKQSGAEGQAACVSCAFEAQARSPSQDDHDAHVHIHLHQSLNLRQDLEERKSPHNPPSHLRQRKTSEPVRQEGFATRLLRRRAGHLLQHRAGATDDRGGRRNNAQVGKETARIFWQGEPVSSHLCSLVDTLTHFLYRVAAIAAG